MSCVCSSRFSCREELTVLSPPSLFWSGYSQQELQVLALRSVSFLCAAADRESHVSYIINALPTLSSILGNKHSPATVRGASLCFERLCNTFSSPLQGSSNPYTVLPWQVSVLEKVANCGVVEHWIEALHDVGKREGVRAASSPLPSDIFGYYKSRQQTEDGHKVKSSPVMAGGTLAGILCSLAKLVAAAPTVLHLVYKLDVAHVVGTLLESLVSQSLNNANVTEAPSGLAGSFGQGWSTVTISSTTSGFADINAEERLLQAMVLAVALLPPLGKYNNNNNSINAVTASGMDRGEEQQSGEEKNKKSIMFAEVQEVVKPSAKVNVPSVLDFGVELFPPWHDSNSHFSTSQWSCLTCLCYNHAYALRCKFCGMIKSSLLPASVLGPPSVVVSNAHSKGTTASPQTSSSSIPDVEMSTIQRAEAPFSSSISCNTANAAVLVTRHDVCSSSSVYLKAYVDHIFPPMLKCACFYSNGAMIALNFSVLESLFNLGYIPDSNFVWNICDVIMQFLSCCNTKKDSVRAVCLARKLIEAHDACNSSESSSRHNWWWGGNNLEEWTLHHRFGVIGSTTTKSEEDNGKSLSGGRDDDRYRVMYLRYGIVHHVMSLLKSLCASCGHLGCANGMRDQCTAALQTNHKWIILETEILASMSTFACGDKWILAVLNLFSQQSKGSLSPEQQSVPPCMSYSRPHIQKYQHNHQLEDTAAALSSLVSILLDGWRKVIPASSLNELERKTVAFLAVSGDTCDTVATVEVQESNILQELRVVAELLKKGPTASPLINWDVMFSENDHHRNDSIDNSIHTSESCCSTTQSSSYQSMKSTSREKYSQYDNSDQQEVDPNLVTLTTILESEEDVTVHEMRESKVLEALLDYFFVAMKCPSSVMQYMGRFFKTFVGNGTSSSTCLRILFHKIQECLTAVEAESFCTNIVYHGGETRIS